MKVCDKILKDVKTIELGQYDDLIPIAQDLKEKITLEVETKVEEIVRNIKTDMENELKETL